MIGTREVPSYVDEPGVDPSRNTESYASLSLPFNLGRPDKRRSSILPGVSP